MRVLLVSQLWPGPDDPDLGVFVHDVVRGLEAPLKALTHLAGAAVSSTGEVALVLDPAGLVRLTAGAGPGGVRTVPVPLAAPAPQQHLLLVDDSVSVRKVVAKLLARGGYRVTTAADGVEAVEKLREGRFDALLTDLEMPRMSGYELLEEVRARAALACTATAPQRGNATVRCKDAACL